MQLLDLDQLRSFVAIVNAGGFTKAAAHVHKTQSAISVQIKRLEETLGVELFAKHGRQMRLTEEGERLVDQARRMLELNNEIVTSMAAPKMGGRIRIGTPVYAERYFPPIFVSFAQVYPEVQIEVLLHESHKLAEELDRGELDLALVTHASTHQRGEIVRMEHLNWVTSPAHRVHRREILPLAIYHSASALRTIATDALEAVGRKYRIAYCSSGHDALISAIAAGLAVGLLPSCSLQSNLRVLTEADDYPALPRFAIALLEGANSGETHIKAMAEHIRIELSNLPQSQLPNAQAEAK
jgi:DNA-binding transcriptional LysR family regulator